MLIRTSANNLIGGVSQQPAAIRRPDACDEMINGWPSPVDGATKRQPTRHVATLVSGAVPVAKYHTVYRDQAEQYQLTIRANGISVFDLKAGVARTVIDDTGTSFAYLASITDQKQVRALSVADYTFIANRNTLTAMSTALSPASPSGAVNDAFVFVRQGAYSSEYSVTLRINNVTYATKTCKTWDGTVSIGAMPAAIGTGLIDSVKTSDIAADLHFQLATLAIPNITYARAGSVIRIAGTASAPINTVNVTDSIGDTAMSAVHKEVVRVQGYLPEVCVHGFHIKVAGDAEIDGDDYWVRFKVNDPTITFGRGIWEEALAPGSVYKFNATTMPHQLTRIFVGAVPEFHFAVVPWGERTVGEVASVPNPSFIGKRVADLFFYKERLGILADETVNLSETGEFFNYFRTTLLTLRDTAPIDVRLTHSKVALMRHAAPYDSDLLLFSDRSQFVLRGGETLSPRTVQIVPAGEYESLVDVAPLPQGRAVYFGFSRGEHCGVRALFRQGDSDQFTAVDVSAQVPNYIDGSIVQMVGTSLEDTVIVRTDTSRNLLWIYKYLFSGNDIAQSAWSKWDLGAGNIVHHVACIENDVWIVVERTGGLYLERLELATGLTDAAKTYVTMLDRRSTPAVVSYDDVADETRFNLPFTADTARTYEAVDTVTGIRYQTRRSGDAVYVRGDLTARAVYVGEAYAFKMTLTPPIVKFEAGGGVIGEHNPPQKVTRGYLLFHGSRTFAVDVRVGVRDKYRYLHNGVSPGISAQSEVFAYTGNGAIFTIVVGTVDTDVFAPGVIFGVGSSLYTVDSSTATSITATTDITPAPDAAEVIVGAVFTINPPLGTAQLLTGDFSYPVHGQAPDVRIVIVNDSPYPSNFIAA